MTDREPHAYISAAVKSAQCADAALIFLDSDVLPPFFFSPPSLALCLKKSIKCRGKILERIAATETCSSVIQSPTTKKENNKLPRHFSMTIYNSRFACIVKHYEKYMYLQMQLCLSESLHQSKAMMYVVAISV